MAERAVLSDAALDAMAVVLMSGQERALYDALREARRERDAARAALREAMEYERPTSEMRAEWRRALGESA